MASKLCQMMVDDSMSDYHFKTIVNATNLLEDYNRIYKQIKNTLLYDPAVRLPHKRPDIDELLKDYTVAAGTLLQASKELTHILGTSLDAARKGTIPQIIKNNNKKLKSISSAIGIDIGSLKVTVPDKPLP